MAPSAYFLIYASTSTAANANQTRFLLENQEQWYINNKRSGITGFLFFKNDKFLHYFEGNKHACCQLWQKLERDKHHDNLKLLMHGDKRQNYFKDWKTYIAVNDKVLSNIDTNLADFDIYNLNTALIHKMILNVGKYQRNLVKDDGQKLSTKFIIHKLRNEHKLFLVIQLLLLTFGVLTMLDALMRRL